MLDKRWPTLAEVLSDQGFLTGGFVGNNGYAGYEFGLDRGFQHFDDYDTSVGQLILSSKMGQTITDTPWVRRPFGYWQMLGRKRSDEVNGEFRMLGGNQTGGGGQVSSVRFSKHAAKHYRWPAGA